MKRLFAAALLFFAIASPASAELTVTTTETQAGDPSNVTIDARFTASPSRVDLSLPPGLVGNPNVPGKTKCPVATFRAGACPGTSDVGDASATSGLFTLTGNVYNLVPEPGEPARLGIAIELLGLFPLVRNEASISLRPDGGLSSTIASLETGGLNLNRLSITLDDSFMTLPTSCGTHVITLNGESDTFATDGCENVPFTPSVAAALQTTQRAVPSGATVTLNLPEGDSHVKRAEIVLPEGTTLSPGVANGLAGCSDAQFAGEGCPAAAQVGEVSFVTPLLGTLGGRVYFGDGFRLYVVVDGPGVQVKLAGDVKLNPANGQITTVFDNLPQVPFTAFALSFAGGAKAVLNNPSTCGEKTLSATLTPWSGTAPKHATASFTIDQGCALPAFAPGLQVSAASTAAGRPAGSVTMTITRPDGAEDLSRVTADLPPGLAGSLKGLPPGTRVGSVSATAGAGEAPVALSGDVFLTGPQDGGLAGFQMVIPGKVGPVDLGTVTVNASIKLRPDGGLTVTTTPLPRLVGGVPVSIRSFALTLDRPGFILNASSCAEQAVNATLEGVGGTVAKVSAPYHATDCAGLAFAPKLEATLGARGKTKVGAFPPLKAVITVPPGQSSTAVADVALPQMLGLDLKKLAKACSGAQFQAGSCPGSARIGSAVATTPLLDSPLMSPVTLASPALGELPGLALQLSGIVTLPLFGKVAPPVGTKGRIANSFAGIPDVPLERFELTFTGGTNSPLRLNKDACRGPRQLVIGKLTGHNGAVANLSVKPKIVGCAPTVTLRRRGGKLRATAKPGRDGAKVRSVKVGKKTKKGYRVTVKDAAKETWKLVVKVRR
ncbi:hypothetical protein DVA67_015410 [Solirubrobacter sp. CPCC 204708]|uniref:Uncharacterized protein n=1 Tax=Solirubrobacter deserti TaxID=2282478 RepID=A0ABT4RKL7_9ACTN|nr:hypothetical protein [Solirubrobacter deserti]MBE2317369.1 hypothetical protein [Solirubrobacter deserti]MDA0139098.1 hypothetical protein [Solirubrobacter deserti]